MCSLSRIIIELEMIQVLTMLLCRVLRVTIGLQPALEV
jgi:hypothetical protein